MMKIRKPRLFKPNVRKHRVSKKKPGTAPGTMLYTGGDRDHEVRLTLIDYREDHFEEVVDVEKVWQTRLPAPDSVSWLDVSGVHEVEVIEEIGRHLNIHPLIMEDIASPNQRPKMELFDDQMYIVARMLHTADDGEIREEQISIILGKTYVISFQELPGDVFDPVRERLRVGKGIIRKMGPDYLAYALLDLIVDFFFVLLERLGSEVEDLELEVMDDPSKHTIRAIRTAKQTIIGYRKDIWPVRELVSSMIRDESGLVRKKTGTYLRDVYDHVVQIIDLMETYRDQLSGLTDLYLSSLSQRMNEVMQVLTIIGSIFIPLTFIAGVYGMNFAVMPELGWTYGYAAVWGVMIVTGVSLTLFFKRRNWL